MPRGKAWNRDPESIQNLTLSGLAPTFARVNDSANQLLVDAFPETTVQLLTQWEATLGLPDSCTGLGTTIQARQATVLAKFLGNGGQSISYFEDFAANLGYAITITQYAPFRAGQSTAGQPCNSSVWANTWAIHAPLNTVVSFRAGASAVGEALNSWGNAELQCSMEKIAPAHTLLQFIYH